MRILVLQGKHGDQFYKANNPDELHESALKILAENRHWYTEPRKPEDLGFTKETINSLPESLRGKAEADLAKYERDMRTYNNEMLWYDRMLKAEKEQDGNLAYKVISSRHDYEYERFYFGNVQ